VSVSEVLESIGKHRVVAIIRAPDWKTAAEIGRGIIRGGLPIVEVSFNTPGALNAIKELAEDGEAIIGAGTVLDPADVERVVAAGAQFMVAPSFHADVVTTAVEAGLMVGPGVFTPTECHQALSLGAHLLKLFPAANAGIGMMRAISEPFPEARWLPAGGIQPEHIMDWVNAGAHAVGIGSNFTAGGPEEAEARTRHLLSVVHGS
jgi:2-dehydro-3-deoxyphosphogluconate aldolase/(4S)-4-hydroxy-2-oxoglutarate aldolase